MNAAMLPPCDWPASTTLVQHGSSPSRYCAQWSPSALRTRFCSRSVKCGTIASLGRSVTDWTLAAGRTAAYRAGLRIDGSGHQLQLGLASWMTATWCIAVIRAGDLKDSIAAVAAGGGRTSNSRCRPHCSRSGSSAAAPPATGIKGTADVHGVASAITRSPGGQENAFAADRRQSEPNVCCPSVPALRFDRSQPTLRRHPLSRSRCRKAAVRNPGTGI